MQSKYVVLACILFLVSNCEVEQQPSFVLGDKVLVYEEASQPSEFEDGLKVDFYARGYEMQFFDPISKEPFSGTIVDDHTLYRGRYSIQDGFMRELITYYEDGSPSYFALYENGEIIEMKSWYRDGRLKSKLEGGENFVYSYFDKSGIQSLHIENNLQTEYFENGKIKNQIPFDSSKLYHGTAKVYNNDGSIKAELEYKSGKLVTMDETNSQP